MKRTREEQEAERKDIEIALLKAQAELTMEQARAQRIENDIAEQERIDSLPTDEQVKYYTGIIRKIKRFISFNEYHGILEEAARERSVTS